MFCSTCGPVAESGHHGGGDFLGLDAIVIETSVGLESTATIRVDTTDIQGAFAVGDTIPKVGRLARVSRGSIAVVDTRGHERVFELVKREKPGDKAGDKGAATPVADAGPYADRVRKIDDATYEADRSLFKELVAGVTKPGAVRAVPVIDKGEVKGIRISGVGPQTIPAAFGLKSGDTLTAIDGQPLKSANQVLELYAKIDTLPSVELSGLRGGKPLSLTLKLR